MFETGISIADNFDELMALASRDPYKFESIRQQLINQIIASVPEGRQQNMLRYQWRIDQEARCHDNSMGYCIKLSSMMSQRMGDMHKLLNLVCEDSSERFSNRFSRREHAVVRLHTTES